MKQAGWKVHHFICRKDLSASYTVEAAFIVPLILGIIFALLYVLFYEHDKAVLYGNVKREIVVLAQEETLPDTAEWRERLQKHLWIATVKGGTVSKTVMQIRGDGEAQMNLPIPVMELFLDRQQQIQCKYSSDRWQPEQILRQRDIISGTKEN